MLENGLDRFHSLYVKSAYGISRALIRRNILSFRKVLELCTKVERGFPSFQRRNPDRGLERAPSR